MTRINHDKESLAVSLIRSGAGCAAVMRRAQISASAYYRIKASITQACEPRKRDYMTRMEPEFAERWYEAVNVLREYSGMEPLVNPEDEVPDELLEEWDVVTKRLRRGGESK